MKIAIILGTRPEIIKCSPIVRKCEEFGLDSYILHTGQHYSYNMDRVFFEQLELPNAKFNLDVGSGAQGKQTGKMLEGIENNLVQQQPDIVIVQGDTNTVLAGALAAVKLKIRVAHVEAGLRSRDKNMPEEINRILADHCSDFLFAPTEGSKENLAQEGITRNVFVVGNTVVDAVQQNLKLTEKINKFQEIGIKPGSYILATSHRQENVDDKARFSGIIRGLQQVKKWLKIPVIYPIHPRAKKQLEIFGIDTEGITLTDPQDYLGFLQLESKAKVVMTDSGGVQEESCILGIPCVTLRDNTERPETIQVGANILAGTNPERIVLAAKQILSTPKSWVNPFGDGKTADRIIDIIVKNCQNKK